MSFQLENLNVLPDMEVLDGISLDGSHVEWLCQALGQNPKLQYLHEVA